MQPTFRLFRSTSSANRAEYVGTLVTPDGRCYTLEADVSEYVKPDGTRARYFAGRVFGGQDVVRAMLRGAKAQGTIPADLVTLMEQDAELNDPLPTA